MHQPTSVSVIIPVLNESRLIGKLVRHLFAIGGSDLMEVIVVDGGSADNTRELASRAGASVVESLPGRARQMNAGSRKARAGTLYFLHADAFPPAGFINMINQVLAQGYQFGNFRQHINSDNRWVKVNSHLSRLRGMLTAGGDQSFFICKSFFNKLGGFNEDLMLMEDYDLTARAKKAGRGCQVPASLQVVDRKYRYNSYLRVNLSNVLVFSLYRLGVHPNRLRKLYAQLIRRPKNDSELHGDS